MRRGIAKGHKKEYEDGYLEGHQDGFNEGVEKGRLEERRVLKEEITRFAEDYDPMLPKNFLKKLAQILGD
jgi:flagellar biosynthesis/type III secretory pathway protein FliH